MVLPGFFPVRIVCYFYLTIKPQMTKHKITNPSLDECFEEVNGDYRLNITEEKLKELEKHAREWLLIAHDRVDFEKARIAFRAYYSPHQFKIPMLYGYKSARIITQFILGF